MPSWPLPPGVFLVDVKDDQSESENYKKNLAAFADELNPLTQSRAGSMLASMAELDLELELEGKEPVEATVYPPPGFTEMVSCDVYAQEEEVTQRILKGGCYVVQKPPGVEFPSGMEIIRRSPETALPAGEATSL